MLKTLQKWLQGFAAVAMTLCCCSLTWARTPGEVVPAANADAQIKPEEVGLDEKLGTTIPLDIVLRDEMGQPITLRQLVDRPTILTLNYYRCAGICSPQLNGLAEAVNLTRAELGQGFRIVTVSFDERDTPDIAAKKRSNYLEQIKRPIAPADWRFLTGAAVETRRLADAVGFKFKKVGDDFAHPGALMFLSPKGVITRYMYGTSYVAADIEMAVNEAAQGKAQPTINKWLAYCFSYDPVGKKYALNVTRIAGTVILGAAMAFAIVLIFKGQRDRSTNKGKA
jgi:protein SCO1/2